MIGTCLRKRQLGERGPDVKILRKILLLLLLGFVVCAALLFISKPPPPFPADNELSHTPTVNKRTESITVQTNNGQPGFRVRSDVTAVLNSEQGWAGEFNEDVTVYADQPFRIRFELEHPLGQVGDEHFRLQYRRNNGAWINLEAHDFPHPERNIQLDFSQLIAGSRPDLWSVMAGDRSAMLIVPTGQQHVLRVKSSREPMMGVYKAPWDITELSARFRFLPGRRNGVAFVIGYTDSNNYYLAKLLPDSGRIQISQVNDGMEKKLTDKASSIPCGKWLEIEMKIEDRVLEVDFQDEELTVDIKPGDNPSSSRAGFRLPSNAAVDIQLIAFEGVSRTPRVSIVSSRGYGHGAAANDLLTGSDKPFKSGSWVNLVDHSLAWHGADGHGEFEWPVVIRRFADGAETNNQDDRFEFRMVTINGEVAENVTNPVLRLAIPPGHVGGTFVESPGRIGPWQASNGDLYFIMEPTETDNLFMMIKSMDDGRTWQEVDGANRPTTGDLESVDSRMVGNTIHILHQVTRSARYHAFRTSDHPTHPDSWATRDEVAGVVDAVAQNASLVVRSDGSSVAFYLGQEKIHYSIRAANGIWSPVKTIDAALQPNQAGPQAVLGKNNVIHVAYYGVDGTIWYRRFLPDNTLTPRQLIAEGAGQSDAEYGAVLPLVYNSHKNEIVIIYRLASGTLWERRIINDNPPTDAVKISDMKVVTDAVDSQQVGADAVINGQAVHLLFIGDPSRSIFSIDDKSGWQNPRIEVDDISGSWVRGNVYSRRDGVKVYGYIYDAGSDGGAGMNRFGELELH